jgi:hypothetical protein
MHWSEEKNRARSINGPWDANDYTESVTLRQLSLSIYIQLIQKKVVIWKTLNRKTLNLSVQSIMGASFNQFRKHIWGPFLKDIVNISLREQFIHK